MKCNINYLVKRTQKIFEYHKSGRPKKGKKRKRGQNLLFFSKRQYTAKVFFFNFCGTTLYE